MNKLKEQLDKIFFDRRYTIVGGLVDFYPDYQEGLFTIYVYGSVSRREAEYARYCLQVPLACSRLIEIKDPPYQYGPGMKEGIMKPHIMYKLEDD